MAILKVCGILKGKRAYVLTRYIRKVPVNVHANWSSNFLVIGKRQIHHSVFMYYNRSTSKTSSVISRIYQISCIGLLPYSYHCLKKDKITISYFTHRSCWHIGRCNIKEIFIFVYRFVLFEKPCILMSTLQKKRYQVKKCNKELHKMKH